MCVYVCVAFLLWSVCVCVIRCGEVIIDDNAELTSLILGSLQFINVDTGDDHLSVLGLGCVCVLCVC